MGILFDLDGVIVDTAKFHFQAWRRLANDLGFDFDEKQNEQLKGVSRRDSLELILQWGGIELSEEEKLKRMALKNDRYLELIDTLSQDDILPGVLPLLADLEFHKIPMGLGSASKNTLKIIGKLKLRDFFRVVIDGNKVTNGKPHPETFLKGAEGLNLPPEKIIVFEDSPKGIQAAKTGGFKAIGIGNAKVLYQSDFVIPGFENITYNTILELYKRLTAN